MRRFMDRRRAHLQRRGRLGPADACRGSYAIASAEKGDAWAVEITVCRLGGGRFELEVLYVIVVRQQPRVMPHCGVNLRMTEPPAHLGNGRPVDSVPSGKTVAETRKSPGSPAVKPKPRGPKSTP